MNRAIWEYMHCTSDYRLDFVLMSAANPEKNTHDSKITGSLHPIAINSCHRI